MQSTQDKHIANREEIQPRRQSVWEDVPLTFFTLLSQLAVGSFWAIVWMFPRFWIGLNHEITFMQLLPFLVVGLFLAVAILASFSHLGTKKNVWRTFANLQKSWLSRETLFTVLFGVGWLVSTAQIIFQQRDVVVEIGITASLGLGLIYSMAQVYRLRTVPSWNSWRTNVAFILSALLLGESFIASLLTFEYTKTGIAQSSDQWVLIGSSTLILLLAELLLIRRSRITHTFDIIRMGYILLAIALAAVTMLDSGSHSFGISPLLFLIVLMEEGIGRLSFYSSRNEISPSL
jgi:DMSO reductase anchor subunit